VKKARHAVDRACASPVGSRESRQGIEALVEKGKAVDEKEDVLHGFGDSGALEKTWLQEIVREYIRPEHGSRLKIVSDTARR